METKIQFDEAAFWKWLKRQKATRKFTYTDTKGCMVASFAKEAMKLKAVDVGPFHVEYSGGQFPIPNRIGELMGSSALDGPFTISQARKAFKEAGLL